MSNLFRMKIIYLSLFAIALTAQPADCHQVEIQTDPIFSPILKGNETNPIFRIRIKSNGSQELGGINLNLEGPSDLKDVKSLAIYYTGTDSTFHSNSLCEKQTEIKERMHLKTRLHLKDTAGYLWIACQLHDDADLRNTLSIGIDEIKFRKRKLALNADPPRATFRYGLALKRHNHDGIHTTRIPGLATSPSGTLLAIYDARKQSSRDLQGDIDIGLSRSFDDGNTWQPMQVILDMGKWGGLPEKYNGVSDACILVNGTDIFVAGLWMHGVINEDGRWIEGLNEDSTAWNHQWRNRGSQAGLSPMQTSQFLLTRSTDDGKTWSEPENLTQSCKKEDWWLWAPAPGSGIVMANGTLVFPTQGRDEDGLPLSNITYSQDNGVTWETSNPASFNTTESAVVEYRPGRLMLNIRDNRNRDDKSETNGRAVYTTVDMGKTWIEHPSSHQSLIEPVCMASLHKHQYSINGIKKEILLFSNPNSKYQRSNLTIKMSFDQGATWPQDSWVLLDEGKGRGYSCITSIDEKTIGIVYEGSRADLIFQKIDLSDYLR
jgi:sialidase-1